MNISTVDAQGLYTKMLIDIYNDRLKPTSFLRSFFPTVASPTLEVSIEVQRNFEKIAVDVVRGTDGNRNQWTRTTEKIFIPPYFNEWFDKTELQLYDRLYGATEINDKIFTSFVNSVVDHTMDLQNKIERSYELQCAQVLQTGIVTITSGAATNIDFKRKAASIVDPGAGQYWANNVDLFNQLKAAGTFLRTIGKTNASTFNLILGGQAFTDMLANTKFTARQNLFNMALDQVVTPQRNAIGANLNGYITAGAYRFNVWTYPQYYDNAAGVATPYIDEKLAIVIPEVPQFKMAFAAVPQLIEPNTMPFVGAFKINEYVDQRKKALIVEVESAGLAVPTAIDTIYTLRAVAA